jgi:hypothetical protein
MQFATIKGLRIEKYTLQSQNWRESAKTNKTLRLITARRNIWHVIFCIKKVSSGQTLKNAKDTNSFGKKFHPYFVDTEENSLNWLFSWLKRHIFIHVRKVTLTYAILICEC